jgi:hypothetical protein
MNVFSSIVSAKRSVHLKLAIPEPESLLVSIKNTHKILDVQGVIVHDVVLSGGGYVREMEYPSHDSVDTHISIWKEGTKPIGAPKDRDYKAEVLQSPHLNGGERRERGVNIAFSECVGDHEGVSMLQRVLDEPTPFANIHSVIAT